VIESLAEDRKVIPNWNIEYDLESTFFLRAVIDLLDVSSEKEDGDAIDTLFSIVHEHIDMLNCEDEEVLDWLEE